MSCSSPSVPSGAADLELEAIICRMGDQRDLVEIADLITNCLSDDSVDALDRPDSFLDASSGASSADESASEDTDPSADAEDLPESVERSELVLHLIPTDVPWAMVFLSTFSAVTCVRSLDFFLH